MRKLLRSVAKRSLRLGGISRPCRKRSDWKEFMGVKADKNTSFFSNFWRSYVCGQL